MGVRTTTSAADKAQARRELAEALHATITEKVDALTGSEAWRAYLDAAMSFHDYSAGSVGVFESVNLSTGQVRRSAA